MSGINVTFLLKRISSASGVVGPLAPSATSFALILDAFFSVITSSRAAGTSMSTSSSSSSSFVIGSLSGMLTMLPVFFFKEHVSKRSNIAKALNCTRRLLEVHLEVPSRFFDIDGHTSAGGRISSKRSSDYQRFAGDDSEGIVSFVLAVLIHEPCHSLRVCVDVGCGNVSEGTNYLADQGKERSRQSLEFRVRELFGVDCHSSFGSAEWDARNRALPSHPH